MIDVQRIIALSQQPRRGLSGGEPAALSTALLVLGDLGHEETALATPIAWSRAACHGAAPDREGEPPGKVCALCPLKVSCRSALMAGAPSDVQMWRARVDGERLLPL